MAAGDPLAEWGYITPQYSHGIGQQALSRCVISEQAEAARMWFLANFEPLSRGGPYFGFAGNGVGFGQGSFAPEHWPAHTILQCEFGSVVQDSVLSEVAAAFELQSLSWRLIPGWRDQPYGQSEGSQTQSVIAALDQMAAVIEALRAAHGGMGHNQGPSLLSAEQVDDAERTGAFVRTAVQESPSDQEMVGKKRDRLASIGSGLGKTITQALVRDAVTQEFNPMLSLSIRLFHVIWHVVLEIGSWLSHF